MSTDINNLVSYFNLFARTGIRLHRIKQNETISPQILSVVAYFRAINNNVIVIILIPKTIFMVLSFLTVFTH